MPTNVKILVSVLTLFLAGVTAFYQQGLANGQLPAFYTDDTRLYVEAAQRLGWEAEVFTDAAHFKEEIRKRRTASPKSPT